MMTLSLGPRKDLMEKYATAHNATLAIRTPSRFSCLVNREMIAGIRAIGAVAANMKVKTSD